MDNKILQYLDTHPITKLHLGCGMFPKEGWLNTDINVKDEDNIVRLDVRSSFDIPDNSFDYIYSEHLIEHVDYFGAINMLKESYRVLKPGGVLRISTPKLEFLIDLYLHPDNTLNKEYIEYDSKRSHLPNNPMYIISNFHTNWGHKIIYDIPTLRNLLEECGFRNIKQCNVDESTHEYLKNAEMHGFHFLKYGGKYEFNQLQSMVFEAQK